MAGAGRDERAWVRGAQAGSVSDFEALFRAHWPRAYRAAYLVVHDPAGAEDVAQEAFIAAVRALDRFDVGRPFGPWLHRIVVNRAIDWARARTLRREVRAGEAIEASRPGSGKIPPPRSRHDLVAALASLSPDHRAVVVLRYVLEYTPGEIARMLELPRGTVNSRLRRGLDALQRVSGAGGAMTAGSSRDALWRSPFRTSSRHSGAPGRWYEERMPNANRFAARGRGLRLLVAVAVLAALVAAALSPPGRAVGGWIRDRVAGEEATEPALVRLPTTGRLLVVSEQGPWIVRPRRVQAPARELRGRVVLPQRALRRRHPGTAGRRTRTQRRPPVDSHTADTRRRSPVGADARLPRRLPRREDVAGRRR